MNRMFDNVNFSYKKDGVLRIMHCTARNINSEDIKKRFALHTHDWTEVYILFRGKMQYYIDGVIYDINPYDMLIIPAGTLHQSIPVDTCIYERCVFDFHDYFFKLNSCEEYISVIKGLKDYKYKIPGYYVKQTRIPNIISDLNEYVTSASLVSNEPVIHAKATELMYILNNNTRFEIFNRKNEFIQQILNFIDENYKSEVTLEHLEKKFNYSKNHICRVFKEATGMSIKNYINIKRFNSVKELHKNGASLTDACFKSGFNNYSTFYTAYVKANHHPPNELNK